MARSFEDDYWNIDALKLFVGNIPSTFSEEQVLRELAITGITPWQIKLRQGRSNHQDLHFTKLYFTQP